MTQTPFGNFVCKSDSLYGSRAPHLEGVELGLEAEVSGWRLGGGEEAGQVSPELEDLLLKAVVEAGLLQVPL